VCDEAKAAEEIEITPEMVLAGLTRMRKSCAESEQSSGDVLVVLEMLESALCSREGGNKSCLTPSSKNKILADTLQYL